MTKYDKKNSDRTQSHHFDMISIQALIWCFKGKVQFEFFLPPKQNTVFAIQKALVFSNIYFRYLP